MTGRRTVSTDFLTVRELAALLRVKPRKVYGRRFKRDPAAGDRKAAVSARRYRGVARTARCRALGVERSSKRPPIIVGSPHPLLDWALRESGSGIASFLDGSLDGLDRLRRGEAIAAGIHLIETGPDGWNRRHVQDAIGNQPIVLLEWAWRDRGLLVGAGNPLDIDGIQALRGHRFIPRQPGAGSQVLLEKLPPGTRAVHGRARLSGAHCPQRGRGCGERARRQGGRGLRSGVSPGSFTLISCRSRASAMTSRCGGGTTSSLPSSDFSLSGAVPSSHGRQASSATMISVPPVPYISTAPEPARPVS